jgi:hypothetical protein
MRVKFIRRVALALLAGALAVMLVAARTYAQGCSSRAEEMESLPPSAESEASISHSDRSTRLYFGARRGAMKGDRPLKRLP